MDYFKFDLQLFSVAYTNPATATSGDRHAIVLNTQQYHAFYDETLLEDPSRATMTTMGTKAAGVFDVLGDVAANGTYFFGVDGELYAQSTADAHNNTLKSLIRNETGASTEKFLMGTVTITGGAVTGVEFFAGDNMWYGETIDVIPGVTYTKADGNGIFSVGATGSDYSNATVFEVDNDAGSATFTVEKSGKVTFNGKAATRFVRVLKGDMTVNLADYANSPANYIFENGSDDAFGTNDHLRGTRWDWLKGKTAPTIGALAKGADASITFTGITTSTAAVKVNNRNYTISNGVKFVRDFADDKAGGYTSVIKSIEGTDGDDTIAIGGLNAGTNLSNDEVAVSGNIDLGAGTDTITLGDTEQVIRIGGTVVLGDGDDNVSFVSGAKDVVITGGITGGAGTNTYNFANAFVNGEDATKSTSIKINDFKSTDTLNIGTLTITTTNTDANFAITAGKDSFALGDGHAGVYVVNNNWTAYATIENKYLFEGVTYKLAESAGTVEITKKTANMVITKTDGVQGLAAGSAFTIKKNGVSIAYAVTAGTEGALVVTATRTEGKPANQTEVYTWEVPAESANLQASFVVADKVDGTLMNTVSWGSPAEVKDAATTTKYLKWSIPLTENDATWLKADGTQTIIYGDGTNVEGARKDATLAYDAANTKYTLAVEGNIPVPGISLSKITDYNIALTDSRADKTAVVTISDLADGQSVEMAAATAGSALKFTGVATYSDITGAVVFTAGAGAAAFRAALDKANEAVTVNGNTIVLTAKAESNDGIAVDKDGAVSGLDTGDAFKLNGVDYVMTTVVDATLDATGLLTVAPDDVFKVADVTYAVKQPDGSPSVVEHRYNESGMDSLVVNYDADDTVVTVEVTPSGENAKKTTFKLSGDHGDSATVVMNRTSGKVELYEGVAELTSNPNAGNNSLTGKLDAESEAVTITANTYTDGDLEKQTTVQVTTVAGVIIIINGFDAKESVSIGDYTYVVNSDGTSVSRYKTSEGASAAVEVKLAGKTIGEILSSPAELTANEHWLGTSSFTVADYPALNLADETLSAALASNIVTLKRNPGEGEGEEKITVATLEKTGNTYTLTRTAYENAASKAVNFEITAPAGASIITEGFSKPAKETAPKVPADSLTVDLAAGSTVTINGVGYKAAEATVLSIAQLEEDPWTKTTTLDSGAVALLFDGVTNEVNTAEKGSVVLLSGTANTALTVTADGVISGLKAGDVFTVSNGNKFATRYEVAADGKSITATNGFIGTYEVTDLAKVTITSDPAGPDAVAQDGTALQAIDGALKVGLSGVDDTNKFIVVKATVSGGVITGYSTEIAAAKGTVVDIGDSDDDYIIGNFQVSKANGVTTIEYVDGSKTLGTTAVLDFDGYVPEATVKFVTSAALPSTAVSAENLAAGTNVTGIDNGVEYMPVFKLASDASTIKLTDLAVGTHYFAVTPKEAGKGFYNCEIATAETTTGFDHATTNYFAVTVTQATTTTKTYDVSYYPASKSAAAIELIDASWAGITVDASALTKEKAASVNVTPTGESDMYAITGLNAGVVSSIEGYDAEKTTSEDKAIVYRNDSEAKLGTATYANGTYAIVYQAVDGTALEKLILATDAHYSVSSENVAGAVTITIKQLAAGDVDTYKASGGAFIQVATDGTTKKVTYVPKSTGIKLTGLTEQYGTSTPGEKLHVTFDGTGLPAVITAVNIYDGEVGSATRTDYDLQNLRGGVAVQYATAGEDESEYVNTYKNGIEIALSDLGTNSAVYYAVVQKSVKDGVVTYGLGEALTTKPTDPSVNYFTVEAVDADTEPDGKAETIKITYTQATAEGKAIDLTDTIAGGTAVINAKGTGADITKVDVKALVTAVDCPTTTSVTVNNVDKAVDVVDRDDPETPPAKAVVHYTTSYTLKTAEIDLYQVKLANVAGSEVYYAVTMEDATTGHGVKEISIQKVAVGAKGDNYFTAVYTPKALDGSTPAKITLTYHPKDATDAISRAILSAAGQIPVTGTVDGDIITAAGKGGVTIELTKDSDGMINYDVTAVSYEATVTNVGDGDSVAYTESFVMGSADTITLGKTAGTVYYEVTATGGGVAEKGVWTCSIGGAIDVSGVAADKLDEFLAKYNYVKVTTDEQTISVDYQVATDAKTTPKIDLSKNGALKIDASGVSENVTKIAIEDTATGKDPKSYTVNGIPEEVLVTTGGTKVAANYAAVNSVKYYDGVSVYSDALALTNGSGILYYAVTRTAGEKDLPIANPQNDKTGIVTYTVETTPFAKTASDGKNHYFKVDYSYAGIVTITYVNADGDANFDLATIGQQVKVNASGLSDSVTKLDITDQTGAGVNYALTEMNANVEIIGQGAGDTVSYKAEHKFALGTAIALGEKTKAYYTLTATTAIKEDGTETVTYTIGAATETEPTSGNYFTAAYDSKNKVYTVRYHKAEGDEAIDLSGVEVKVPVDASAAATYAGIDIQNDTAGSAVSGYALEGLAGGVTVTGATPFTASYATSLDWTKAGTYYAAVDPKVAYKYNLKTGTTAEIKASTQYLTVKVTKGAVVAGVATPDTLTFKLETANANGYMVPGGGDDLSGTERNIDITAPETAWNLDLQNYGSAENVRVHIYDAAAGSVFTRTNVTHFDVTTAELKVGEKVSVQLQGAAKAVDYVAAAEGKIHIMSDGAVDYGTLLVTDAADIGGSVAGAVTVVKGDGVNVTFEKGELVSVKGLDKGEVITISGLTGTMASYNGTYTADDVDGLTITRNDGKKAGLSAEGGEILDGMTYSSGDYNVGVFSWTADATGSYLKVTDNKAEIVTTSTPGVVEYNASTPTYYIKTTVAITGVAPNQRAALTLTPMVSNAAKLLNETKDFTGTVNITAPSTAALIFDKTAKATGANVAATGAKINVTGAAAGSEFAGMGSGDTVTTAELASGAVTVNNRVYTVNGSEAQSLTFTGDGVLTSAGVFTVGAGTTEATGVKAANETVYVTGGDGVVVTFAEADGKVAASSITGLNSGETVTVKNAADGSTTVYSLSGGYLQKVVTDAAGNTTTSKTTTAADATTNILSDLPYGTGSISGVFAFDDNSTGYFKATAGTIASIAAGPTTFNSSAADGTIYVVATNVYDKDAKTNTLTLTPMKVSGGALVAAAPEDVANLTITALNVTATNPVTFDQGTTFAYKVNVKNADSFDEFKNLVSGSSVTTDNDFDAEDVVTVNGAMYVSGADDQHLVINSYGAAGSKIVSGVVQIGGVYTGADGETKLNAPTSVSSGKEVKDASSDITAVYKAGDKNKDGVKLTFAAGAVTVIGDIEKGESVTLTYPTETVTYTKKDTGKIWKETTTNAGVKSLAVSAVMVDPATVTIIDADPAQVTAFTEHKAVSQFNWTAGGGTGYFLVKASDGTTTIEKQTTATTIDFNDKGKVYAKVAISADNTIGAAQVTFVKIDNVGAEIEESLVPPTYFKTINIKAPTAALTYTKAAGAAYAVDITGAAAGSTLADLKFGDNVTTAALAAGASVTVNGKVYNTGVTGEAKTAFVIQGNGHVTSGIYGLTAANATLAAAVTDYTSTEYPTTVQEITYSKTAGTDGAVVTAAGGKVKSVTGIGAGEKVVIAETLTTRTGGTFDVSTTTYEAKANGTDPTKTDIVKTVLANGVTTTYTKTYDTDAKAIAADVISVTDWTQDSIVVDGRLTWGGTGYYQAAVTTASGVTTYAVASAVAAGQGVNPITYDPLVDTNNYYLKANTSGDAIKGYTIDSFTIVKAQKNGELKEISGATINGTIKITAPDAKLNLPAHTTYDIALNDAVATTYTGLGAKDVITMKAGVLAEAKVTVDGAVFKMGAATTASDGANYVQFTKGGAVTSGSFVMQDLDLQTADGKTVLHYSTASEAAAGADGNDGVVIVFAGNNVISSISDLEAKESVRTINTATGLDDETIVTTTTFTTEDGAAVTKTVETVTTYKDGTKTTETVVSKLTGATAGTNLIAAAFNTETTSTFDWTAKGGTGYFLATGPEPYAANVVKQANKVVINETDNGKKYVKVALGADNTVNSISLWTVGADGSMTQDKTSAYSATIAGADLSGAITLPRKGQLGGDLLSTITVTAAKAGQVIGFNGGASYVAAEAALNSVFNADGTAYSGKFRATATAQTMNLKQGTSTLELTYGGSDAQGAVITVDEGLAATAPGTIRSITGISAGESVTIKETDATGAVTTRSFTGSDAGSGKILVTRVTTTSTGTSTTATYTFSSSDANIYSLDNSLYTDTGAVLVSNFDGTVAGGAGYFALSTAGAAAITGEQKGVTIADGTYVQAIAATADFNIAVKVVTVKDGKVTPAADNSALKKLSVTAPDGEALVFAKADAYTLAMTGIAKNSIISGLHGGDTVTTGALKVGDTVTVGAAVTQVYTAAADKGTIEFVGEKVDATPANDVVAVKNGVLTLATGVAVRASGATADDTKKGDVTTYGAADDTVVTYTFGAGDAAPTLTITNGAVESLDTSKLGAGTVVVAPTGGVTVTYGKLTATMAALTAGQEITTLKLAKGTAVSAGTLAGTSTVDNGKFTFYGETGPVTSIYEGSLRMTAVQAANFRASGKDKSATTDDTTLSELTGVTDLEVAVTGGVVTSFRFATAPAAGTTAKATLTAGTTVTKFEIKDGQVTKTVTANGSTTTSIAFVSDMTADLMGSGVRYAVTGDPSSTDADASKLVGHFNWDMTPGRETGYFQVNTKNNTVTVADQPSEVAADLTKTGNVYLVANVSDPFELGTRTLTLAPKIVAANNLADTVLSGTVTIKAPTANGLVYDNTAAKFNVAITGAADDSNVMLRQGDTMTTATLKKDNNDGVIVNGQMYWAGANGTLTFYGETGGTDLAPTYAAALFAGSVVLNDGIAVSLAGSKETTVGAADDFTVLYTDVDPLTIVDRPILKVANGKVSSITGLTEKDSKVTVTDRAAKTMTVYTVLTDDGTMVQKQVFADANLDGVADGAATETTFATIVKGKEVYAAAYKAAATTGSGTSATTTILSDLSWTNSSAATTGYFLIGDIVDLTGKDADGNIVGAPKNVTISNIIGNTNDKMVSLDTAAAVDTDATATTPRVLGLATRRGQYVLKVSAGKFAGGVTKINAVDVMQVTSNGALKKVTDTYAGVLTLDGEYAVGAGTDNGAISYAAPAATKRSWRLTVTNLAANSVITNLGKAGDTLTSTLKNVNDAITVNGVKYVAAEANVALAIIGGTVPSVFGSGAFTMAKGATKLYVNNMAGVSAAVTYNTVKDDVKVTVVNGEVTGITGFSTEGEKLTVETENVNGKITDTYTVSKGMITRVRVADDGTTTTATAVAAANFDLISGDYSTPVLKDVEFNFTWTNSGTTGYFKVPANGKVTVQAAKGTIKTTDHSPYIAVALTETGVVESIKQVVMGSEGMEESGQFAGTLTLNVPKAKLMFDRLNLSSESISETTVLAITNVAATSELASLKAGDTVSTVALAEKDKVTVNGSKFVSAVKSNTMKFAAATDASGSTVVAVAGGKVLLDMAELDPEVVKAVFVEHVGSATGSGHEIAVGAASKINVSVSGTNYTVEGLSNGESFTVKIGDTTTTYIMSNGVLQRSSDGGTTVEAYAIGSATSVTSAILTGTKWTPVKDTFVDDGKGNNILSNGGKLIVDLAAADKRITDATKAKPTDVLPGDGIYDYVVDNQLTTSTKAKADVKATPVDDASAIQQKVGEATTGRFYDASVGVGNYAQTINLAKGWSAKGSTADDAINTATSGTDMVFVSAGNDAIKAQGASDIFNYAAGFNGNDTITGYATTKDKIFTDGNGFEVTLGADVRLYTDDNNSLTLKGMGNGQAVTIDNASWFFGNGKGTKATFTYVEGGFYYGNTADNTVSVKTDATKESKTKLGDKVVVNLADSEHYKNIKIADASGSANSVELIATENGSTLKGGSYQSTLKGGMGFDSLVGGSGADMFWLDSLDGSDTITGYTSGQKDAVYLGESLTIVPMAPGGAATAEVTIKAAANNKDVELTNSAGTVKMVNALGAAKPIRVSTDGTQANTLSYYVGNTGKANSFSATIGTDLTIDANTKDAALTSYYVGTAKTGATILDTLAIKTAKGQKAAVNAKFSLEAMDAHMSLIDVLDTSAVNIAGSNVTLQGATAGEFTLKGTNGTKNVKDSFDLTNLTAGANKVTLTNLDVGEVIEIAAGLKLGKTSTVGQYSITNEAGTVSYGTLAITGATRNCDIGTGATAGGKTTYTLAKK